MNNFDFGGTATLYGVKCQDGVTLYHSFDDQDGKRVPLVWQHDHKDPTNVLGHAILKKNGNGMYCYCKFNDSDKAQSAKAAVKNGDLDSLSIYADKLTKQGNIVTHGTIREVSLVYAGANPGAKIDYVKHSVDSYGDECLAHAETYEDSDSSIIIHGDGFIEDLSDVCEDYDIQYFNDNQNEERNLEEEKNMEDNKNTITLDKENLENVISHAVQTAMDVNEEKNNMTVGEILDTLTPEQKKVVEYIIDNEVEEGISNYLEENNIQHSDMDDEDYEADDDDDDDDNSDITEEDLEDLSDDELEDLNDAIDAENDSIEQSDMNLGGNDMYENIFEGTSDNDVLAHAAMVEQETMDLFLNDKVNFKTAFERARNSEIGQDYLAHAAADGIRNISNLFPEPKLVGDVPFLIKKDADWVKDVFADLSKQSFGRVKSIAIDITKEEARAKGYIKGNQKVEQQFESLRRVTTPTVVYSKAKLDKQDILEITDFNVVAIMKQGLDVNLRYEIARQILISDGREVGTNDKINNENIRPISLDSEVYTIRKTVTIPVNAKGKDILDLFRPIVLNARSEYHGSGSLKMYAGAEIINSMLLAQDTTGRDLFDSEDKLATALRAKKIVEVPDMNSATYKDPDTNKNYKVLAIFVNLTDYIMGAVKGGETSSYEQFDIDYNQMKYLTETFCSGALVVPKSAIVIMQEIVTSNPTG